MARCAIAAIALALVIVFGGVLPFDNSQKTSTDDQPPIIEIATFEPTGNKGLDRDLEGLRIKLVSDLSRFQSVRIRKLPRNAGQAAPDYSKLTPATYRIDGIPIGYPDLPEIEFTVSRVADGAIVWSNSLQVPNSSAEYDDAFAKTVRLVAFEVIGARGAIETDLKRELRARELRRTAPLERASYECVLLFNSFDNTKSSALRLEAEACLTTLIENDSTDSGVWAAWSMMEFLGWTQSNDRSEINSALASANRAIDLDPTNANAHEYQGSILMALGKRQSARTSYERALKLNPSKPDLYVLIGWELALGGDWTFGIPKIAEGVSMSVSSPGWMRIPLSMDAFRTGDYASARYQADQMIHSGDGRGNVLALAAAQASGDQELVLEYKRALQSHPQYDRHDPLKEIRSVFNNKDILDLYGSVLDEVLAGPS